tara:strand:+ start:348 stop:1094 length:747 start_codon:yes stop_codon:yes gene_type:complete
MPVQKRVDKKVKSPQQYESTDYGKFKFVEANRDLNEHHINEIIQEIENNDLRNESPVKVNKEFEIMEGQHTFAGCEREGLPVRYIFSRMTVDDIGRYNGAQRPWSSVQMLNHYCIRGFEHYLILNEFVKKYKYPISTLLVLLSGEHTKQLFKDYKFGKFVVKQSIAEVQTILDKVSEFKEFNDKVYRHKTFVLTYIDCLTHPDFDHHKLVHKVSIIPEQFIKCDNQVDYLRMIEDVYNYRNQQPLRLY